MPADGRDRGDWRSSSSFFDGWPEGLVDMTDAKSLPVEAFAVTDEDRRQVLQPKEYCFTRPVKGSILLNLHVDSSQRRDSSCSMLATAGVYLKASEKQAHDLFLATIVGVGALDLSQAVAQCGYVPGAVCLLLLALIFHFLSQRLVEAPEMFRVNMESYGDIARVCLGGVLWRIAVLLVIFHWFGVCSIYLTSILQYVDIVFCRDEAKCVNPAMKLVCSLTLVPLVFKTSSKDLQKWSRISLYCMGIMGIIEMACAVSQRFFIQVQEQRTSLVGMRIPAGAKDMLLSFDGIAILPYIVSDMHTPGNAKKMITKACTKQFLFYIAVSMVSYFGWGSKAIGSNPVRQLRGLGNGPGLCALYSVAAAAMSMLFAVKTWVTFPILFWPLCREIESYLKVDSRLEVELRLPWALDRARRHRELARVGVLILTVIPAFLEEHAWYKKLVIAVPLNFVCYLMPSLFALAAILAHRRHLRRPGAAGAGQAASEDDGPQGPAQEGAGSAASLSELREGAGRGRQLYVCRSLFAHTVTTSLVVSVGFVLSLSLLYSWMCDKPFG